MCGHTMMSRLRNLEFQEKLEVAPISAKIHENSSNSLGMCRDRRLKA